MTTRRNPFAGAAERAALLDSVAAVPSPYTKPAPVKRSCGECLMERAEVVHLDASGLCPKCGTNYGAEP